MKLSMDILLHPKEKRLLKIIKQGAMTLYSCIREQLHMGSHSQEEQLQSGEAQSTKPIFLNKEPTGSGGAPKQKEQRP